MRLRGGVVDHVDVGGGGGGGGRGARIVAPAVRPRARLRGWDETSARGPPAPACVCVCGCGPPSFNLMAWAAAAQGHTRHGALEQRHGTPTKKRVAFASPACCCPLNRV
jgi:hypothetical protein